MSSTPQKRLQLPPARRRRRASLSRTARKLGIEWIHKRDFLTSNEYRDALLAAVVAQLTDGQRGAS